MTREAYDQVMNAPHKASLTHELIAAAAGWEAMKAWNDHKERNGEAVDHAKMKQFMAAASAAFIDRIVETKGLDAIDRHRVRQQAEEHYGQYAQYGPPQGQYYPGQYGPPQGQYYPGQYGPPQGQYYGQYGPPQGQYYGQNEQYEHHGHHHHHHHHHDRF